MAEGRFEAPRDDAIATRTVIGGAAPAPMDAMLSETSRMVDELRGRLETARERLERAERELLQVAGRRSSVS